MTREEFAKKWGHERTMNTMGLPVTIPKYDEFLADLDSLFPPAEGAEENIIYHNLTQPFRQILQSVALHGYDIVFAERDCVKCATEFATLHAQRLAEKMVEEKLKNAPKNCPKAAQCAHVEGGLKCPPNVICPI